MRRKWIFLAWLVWVLGGINSTLAFGSATDPYPADGAIDLDPWVILSWRPGELAILHDVYFGTDYEAVANADTADPTGIYQGRTEESSFVPLDVPLDWGQTYYWRVDAINDASPDSPWIGEVWSFTVGPDGEPAEDLTPVAWWGFDEVSGMIAHDYMGISHGTVEGATWTSGRLWGSLHFDGVDDVVITPVSIDQSAESAGVTLCAWVHPGSIQPGRHQVISSDDGGYDWSVLCEGDGNWHVFTGEFSANTDLPVDLAQWQFVAAVFEPGFGIRFYKNGEEVFIPSIDYDTSDNMIAIGDNPGPWDEFFAGQIDEVSVYDSPLSGAYFASMTFGLGILPEYEIEGPGVLSPPSVYKPIHECAKIVYVWGFVPEEATVKVYANKTELIGEATPRFGFADIALKRALNVGDEITATQTVKGHTSVHSYVPVTVSQFPQIAGGFPKPKVSEDIYDCGRIVPVGNLIESVRVRVYEEQTEIGWAEAARKWVKAWTAPLHAHKKVTAVQIVCEDDAPKTIMGPKSDPVSVKSIPSPLPVVIPKGLVVGNDAVYLDGLLTGAHVDVYDHGTWVGGGWAPGQGGWCPINKELTPSSGITAVQELCGHKSSPGSIIDPTNDLKAPVVVGPICDGAQHVVIRNTVINAKVVLLRNSKIVGYGGAVPGDLILAVGGNIKLKTLDTIEAVQYMGTTISPLSNAVTVDAILNKPFVEIRGGHPFFKAEAGEQQIDSPVFPRGKYSPLVNIQACCSQNVKAEVRDIDGALLATLTLKELFPGYFTGWWDWTSQSGWKIPDDIPVGKYTVKVTTGCPQSSAEAGFYVIFDPEEVTASSAFSLSGRGEKGICFAPDPGSDSAFVFDLRPDDRRVFCLAMMGKDCPNIPANVKGQVTASGISGETSQFEAAKKLLTIETGLFGFSTSGGYTYDVVYFLEHMKMAQCYQDTSIFTSMLRSMGIPARPIVGDAAWEYGDTWFFDTWTEVRLDGPSGAGEHWYVFHPHYEPGLGPDRRQDAGKWGDVSKANNDIVIAAGGNWSPSEVSDGAPDVKFGYGTPCKEPEQHFTAKASWLDHLCEDQYWNPESHWSCSPPRETGVTVSFDREFYRVGDVVHTSIAIRNDANDVLAGIVNLNVVVHCRRNKAGEDILYESSEEISIVPGETVTFGLEFQLPLSLNETDSHYVRVNFGDEYTTAPFDVKPLFAHELVLADQVREGAVFLPELTLRNLDGPTLRDINVTLGLPFEIGIFDELSKNVLELAPGEEIALFWELQALSETVVAPLEFVITTSNGGGTTVYDGVAVQGNKADLFFMQPGWPSTSVLATERDFALSGAAGKPCAECTD